MSHFWSRQIVEKEDASVPVIPAMYKVLVVIDYDGDDNEN